MAADSRTPEEACRVREIMPAATGLRFLPAQAVPWLERQLRRTVEHRKLLRMLRTRRTALAAHARRSRQTDALPHNRRAGSRVRR